MSNKEQMDHANLSLKIHKEMISDNQLYEDGDDVSATDYIEGHRSAWYYQQGIINGMQIEINALKSQYRPHGLSEGDVIMACTHNDTVSGKVVIENGVLILQHVSGRWDDEYKNIYKFIDKYPKAEILKADVGLSKETKETIRFMDNNEFIEYSQNKGNQNEIRN